MTETPEATEVAETETVVVDPAELAKWKELARKNEKRAKENAEAALKLREIEESSKSESEKVAQRLAEAEARAKAAELQAMRLQVAAEKGLTTNQAKRLVGDTLEDLQSDADAFLADLPTPKPTAGDKRPREATARVAGDDNDAPVETDPGKLAEAVLREASW